MSNPISVDMRSFTSSSASMGASRGGQSLDARIAALKQKLVDLFEEIKLAIKEQTPETEEKVKMLQMQILATQAQIMQLEALRQQKSQEQQQVDSKNAQAAPNTDLPIGQNLNTFI